MEHLKTYLQLGKLGDILNLLPLLRTDSLAGEKPRLMVAAEFASILDGVDYVDPIIYQGPHFEIEKAYLKAKETSENVLCCQVNGPPDQVLKYTYQPAGQPGAITTSFQKESWRVAGRLKDWDSLPPLVFDKRSQEREVALLKEQGFTGSGRKKPVMLVHLGGASSPFPYADLLRETLIQNFGKQYRILEVPKAERIYDLLALYEKSALLVACDSAPLNLAWACRRLPVFAITNDRDRQGNFSLWHGASWRPNHLWYCRYHDWPDRAKEMVVAISKLSHSFDDVNMLEVVSEYEMTHAVDTGDRNVLRVPVGSCGRDSKTILQDTKRAPYLRDVIRMAIQRAHQDETWIVLYRPNTALDMVRTAELPPFWSYRISDATFVPIGDVFCATRSKWKEILPLIPDLFLSSDYYWSEVVLNIFKKIGAKDLTGISSREPTPLKVSNLLSKTTAHNRELCNTFIAENKIRSRYPKVSEQLECLPLERDKLFLYGYNPSIIRYNGSIWMAYRNHTGRVNTQLALAKIDDTGKVLSNEVLASKEGRSLDDPRLFQVGHTVRVSWVDSSWPMVPTASVVYVADLMPGLTAGLEHHLLPGNDSTSIQKNWVWFSIGGITYCIYRCHPMHEIYYKKDNHPNEWNTCNTEGPKWSYGAIRGGTAPLTYEGKLLRFFHSRLDNEWGVPKYRYYVGAYIMESEPPFRVLKVSKKPILYGSEVDDLTPSQRKQVVRRVPNVVFPAGAIEHGGGWLLSVGLNDCQCALVKIKPNDISF